MDEKILELRHMIEESDNIVFFGGAGVSTESGIPDFRSVDGLYHQKYDYPPETILSHTFYRRHPEEFYRFYKDKMLCLDDATIRGAVKAIAEADMLIIGGTSLVVYPAAGLIDYYNGHKLVVINKSSTGRDEQADLVIQGSIGEVFTQALE